MDSEMTIPSQANAPKRVLEGVTTRCRAKAVMHPRAPCPLKRGDEIVWTASKFKMQKRWIKSQRDNKSTTIQSRSGELADNVTNNNALLRRLKAKGNVRTVSGGNVILEELMYTDASTINVNSYSGLTLH